MVRVLDVGFSDLVLDERGYEVPFHTDLRSMNLAWLFRVVRA